MMAAKDIGYTYDTGKCILKKSPTEKPYDYSVGLNILTQLSLSSELTVALLENEQGSQATVYTRETHEGKTQESCCYHDNGDTLHGTVGCDKRQENTRMFKIMPYEHKCLRFESPYILFPHSRMQQ